MRTCTGIIRLMSGLALGVGALTSVAIGQAVSEDPKSQSAQPGDRDIDRQVNDDGVRRSVQQRAFEAQDGRQKTGNGQNQRGGSGAASFPDEFRTIDGSGNNLTNLLWGAAATDMMRMMSTDYPIASGEIPARADGPSARAVSNAIHANPGDLPNPNNVSDYLWQWGQFLDHDIDETPAGDVAFDIEVPAGDPWFDPFNTGTVVIGMHRSAFEMDGDGERQQLNNITSFIDASNVYGSEDARAAALRANDGTGKLATSEGNLLPFNTDGFPNAPTGLDPTMFFAGDVRANEQAGLTAMHTLFVREHNYWAEQFAVQFPDADGDELFERARAVVAAEMQAITFNEFLPVLLGDGVMGAYSGYNATKEPMISNMFASAAYRVGHTMLSPTIRRLEATDLAPANGDLPLQNAFFAPSITSDNGIDGILRGLASQPAQTIDTYVVDDVRNFLFGPPGAGGFDLASLNIQRGRDHGLADYNAVRVWFGGDAITDLSEISDDPAVDAGLASVYSSVDEVDPWVGLLAEPAVAGSQVGQTLQAILVDQFDRLRVGDRFWYEAYLPEDMVEMVNQQTLATIIRRNTGIGAELNNDVFLAVAPCPADLNDDGVLNFFDVSEFMSMLPENDPRVDYSGHDGEFNFFDISVFLNLYNQGCD
jgi:Animal haem peroxidase